MSFLEDYLSKREEFTRVTAETEAYFARLRNEIAPLIGTGFRQGWRNVTTTNLGHSFPAGYDYRHAISGTAWPTAQAIGDRLAQWHKLRSDLKTAYSSLTAVQQTAAPAPPE